MNYIIREINENETAVLEDFLYEAIFVPEGVQPPEKNIIKKPELQVYVAGFGKGPEILAWLQRRMLRSLAPPGSVLWMITAI